MLVRAGDKHRVFPHRRWLPFLSTQWKRKGSLKKRESERGKIIDLPVTVWLCHENQPTTWHRPTGFSALSRANVTLAACSYVTGQNTKASGEKRRVTVHTGVKSCKPHREERANGGGGFPKTAVRSLSVLTVPALPPQIKGREVAQLRAAVGHVKPRRRSYTCSREESWRGLDRQWHPVSHGHVDKVRLQSHKARDEPERGLHCLRCAGFNSPAW